MKNIRNNCTIERLIKNSTETELPYCIKKRNLNCWFLYFVSELEEENKFTHKARLEIFNEEILWKKKKISFASQKRCELMGPFWMRGTSLDIYSYIRIRLNPCTTLGVRTAAHELIGDNVWMDISIIDVSAECISGSSGRFTILGNWCPIELLMEYAFTVV